MTNIELPEPDFTSYQVDSVMRRNELRSFSASQMRAMFEAGAARERERAELDAKLYRMIRTTLPDGVIFDQEFSGAEQLDAAIDAGTKEPK